MVVTENSIRNTNVNDVLIVTVPLAIHSSGECKECLTTVIILISFPESFPILVKKITYYVVNESRRGVTM